MINKCYNFLNFESWSRVFIKIAYLYHFLRIFKSISNSTSSIINFVEKKKNRKSSSNSDYSNGKCSRPFSTSYVTTWNSTCLAEILDPPIFFFSSYFHFSMDPSLHKWVKIHDAFSSLPYISLYFSPQGMSVTLLSISTNGYRACLISWLLLSHLELSLDRMLYWLIVLYLFFFFSLSSALKDGLQGRIGSKIY